MLHPGARIAVVAPAGPFHPERLASGMATLQHWGYVPVPMANLQATHRYLAGTTEQRHADLRHALTAPDLDAVWFARGGYGTFAALQNLPWDLVQARPVLGFSDATALLIALQQRGLPAIHAPVLQGLADPVQWTTPGAVLIDSQSRDALRLALQSGSWPSLPGRQVAGPAADLSQGRHRGPVTGGNLAVLASLCGTPEQLDAHGKIVVLEELNEPPYRLDRLLSQLRLSGALDGCVGICFGDLQDCEPKDGAFSALDVAGEVLEPLGIPILAGLPVGHGSRNFAFPLGKTAELTATGLRWC